MKKIITLTLLIITIINIFTVTSKAEVISSADLYSKKYSNGLLKWDNMNLECDVVVYKKDGKEYPAYCLQRDLTGVTSGGEYSVTIDKLITNVMVWRAITNGYPYKSISELGCKTEEEAFMATKQAVYCMIYNRDPNTYTALSEAGERCLNALKKIVNAAKKSTATKISSDITITSKDLKWKIDEINKEYVSQTFKVSSQAPINNYKIKLDGNIPEGIKITDKDNNEKAEFKAGEEFKIIIPLKNINIDSYFNIKVEGKVNTKPILYGKSANSNLQDYALTAASYEDGNGIKKVYYTKNNTKIIIVKKEEGSGKALEGVEFELLDDKQNTIFSTLKTNKEGKVEIENLLPGTYYIKETKTLDGYKIYDKLIKVDLDLDEELTVNVLNSENKTDVVVEEKKSEMAVETKSEEVTVKLPKTGM